MTTTATTAPPDTTLIDLTGVLSNLVSAIGDPDNRIAAFEADTARVEALMPRLDAIVTGLETLVARLSKLKAAAASS